MSTAKQGDTPPVVELLADRDALQVRVDFLEVEKVQWRDREATLEAENERLRLQIEALSFPRTNRVEIIDANGRDVVRYYDRAGATISAQDEGRTIKVFVTGQKCEPKAGEHIDMAAFKTTVERR